MPKTLRFRHFLARLKEFESPTFRLGGGRSILLSYKRVYFRPIIAQTDEKIKGGGEGIRQDTQEFFSSKNYLCEIAKVARRLLTNPPKSV